VNKELEEIQQELGNLSEDTEKLKLEELKEILKPKALEVKELNIKIAELDFQLSQLNKELTDLKEEIRLIWQPFMAGTDKCVLDVGGVKLKMEKKLNVKILDDDLITDWLLNNGYKDAMKYQIHAQTFKKIARELKESQEDEEIPGAEYKYFNLITAK